MNIAKIVRMINAKIFIYRIGSLANEFEALTEATDRAEWAMQKFGKAWANVLQEYQAENER